MCNLQLEGEKVIQENSKSAVISKRICSLLILLILLVCMNTLSGCASDNTSGDESGTEQETVTEYSYQEYPLMRNNIDLHLDCVSVEKTQPEKSILLVHGATYSSHEFDIDFEDYSLVKRLADEGYAVWRIDIAGYGRSEKVKNGFMPDTDYAAKDINAAVKKIVSVTGEDKIDVLGWSWGTMTAGRFAGKYPEHLQRLVRNFTIIHGRARQKTSSGTRKAISMSRSLIHRWSLYSVPTAGDMTAIAAQTHGAWMPLSVKKKN